MKETNFKKSQCAGDFIIFEKMDIFIQIVWYYTHYKQIGRVHLNANKNYIANNLIGFSIFGEHSETMNISNGMHEIYVVITQYRWVSGCVHNSILSTLCRCDDNISMDVELNSGPFKIELNLKMLNRNVSTKSETRTFGIVSRHFYIHFS